MVALIIRYMKSFTIIICSLMLTSTTITASLTIDEKITIAETLRSGTQVSKANYQAMLKGAGIYSSDSDELSPLLELNTESYEGLTSQELDNALGYLTIGRALFNPAEQPGWIGELWWAYLLSFSEDNIQSKGQNYYTTRLQSLISQFSLLQHQAPNDLKQIENFGQLAFHPHFTTLPGLQPETMLKLNSTILLTHNAAYASAYSGSNTIVFLTDFYQNFFKLTVGYHLQPVAISHFDKDPGLLTMRVPGMFRLPAFNMVPESKSLNLVKRWVPKLSLLKNKYDDTPVELFLFNLAEPEEMPCFLQQQWGKLIGDQSVVHQDFLWHIKVSSGKSAHFYEDEVLWIGVRDRHLYVSVAPAQGFLLVYEVPAATQKAFLGRLIEWMSFPDKTHTGKPKFKLQRIMIDGETTRIRH